MESSDRPEAEEGEERARAQGGRAALILYFVVAAVVSALGGGQVIRIGLWPQPASGLTFASCGQALSALSGALRRARDEGSRADGEDAALAAFRAALTPEWDALDVATSTCGEAGRGALGALQRLRYAEEHAIRREASELAPLRRSADAALRGAVPP